ncbi:hypothetical protein GCM10011351_17890 [Paraliobacillus quinghaiensis]|uniref:NERD domain-containing protein n=1 Tax=Paraliobacillus quinghaiensis TaxID=470815 RepID=A0A917TQ38_9BACI|nr:nuclease-related domain-containing protein [Paraliobacillus quinghaiensis]GGM32154.1 hypothetical protein GCM10011351_17890 [Paraliobacillus quinghaiensis]
MIILPCEKTAELRQLEVLMARLMRRDPNFQKLDELYGKVSSGYFGESSLDYYLKLVDLDDAFILYGLRLPESGSYFQIDALILTSKICFIIEAKNFKGEISFNRAGQMIRTLDGISEAFSDPMAQAHAQKQRLQHYIMALGYTPLEIHCIVSFTHPKVILNLEENDTIDIMVNQHLPRRMDEVLYSRQKQSYQIEELRLLATILKKNHSPREYNVIEKYEINPFNIKKGVWCPSCKDVMLDRLHSNWSCPKCKSKNRNAQLNALQEYAILYNNQITNKEAREFLGLQSSSVTKRILHHPKIQKVGTTKDSYYILDGVI